MRECRTAHTPRQIEFARLNLSYTVMSKRKLLQLVAQGHVDGWDDPRMPTLSGMRRRGYPPEAIRDFCARVGVAKKENVIDIGLLEHCVREDLNRRAPRAMAVLRPLKVVLTNYPDGQVETMAVVNNPEDAAAGTREVPFGRELYIERDDFMEDPPKKFFRLAPGREVRLRNAYLVTCQEVVKDAAGEIVELRCTYDPATRGGDAPDGRKVKATLHWVSAAHAVDGDGAALRSAVHRREPRGRGREGRADVRRSAQPGQPRRAPRLQAGADARRGDRPVRASSSSGSATSPPIRMAGPARRSSTAPCRSRTRGRRSRRASVAGLHRRLEPPYDPPARPRRPPAWPAARRPPPLGSSDTRKPRRPPLR